MSTNAFVSSRRQEVGKDDDVTNVNRSVDDQSDQPVVLQWSSHVMTDNNDVLSRWSDQPVVLPSSSHVINDNH